MFSIHDNGNKRTVAQGSPIKNCIQAGDPETVDIPDDDDSDDRSISKRSGGSGYSENQPSVAQGADTGTQKPNVPTPAQGNYVG